MSALIDFASVAWTDSLDVLEDYYRDYAAAH
jgi:hypothetical protein